MNESFLFIEKGVAVFRGHGFLLPFANPSHSSANNDHHEEDDDEHSKDRPARGIATSRSKGLYTDLTGKSKSHESGLEEKFFTLP